MSLLILGFVLWLVGSILFLVAAFRASIWWLLGCLFIPFVQLFFLFFHWSKAWKPFLIQVVGIIVMLVGAFQMGGHVGEKLYEQWLEFRAVQMEATAPAEIPAGFNECQDAEGRITYTNLPCMDNEEAVESLPTEVVPVEEVDEEESYEDERLPPVNNDFQCDGRTRCTQMTSCEEATFFINHCPNTEMDGDSDGVPCESQWCS